MNDRFVYMIFIDSSPEKVWEALTSGVFTKRFWAGRRIESDWSVGAPVHIYLDETDEFEIHGEVLEVQPNSVLAYSWRGKDDDISAAATVRFELLEIGGSVRLTLVHEPLEEADMVRQGWAAILSSLKSFLETGNPVRATSLFRRAA